jgi:hypothetical protein
VKYRSTTVGQRGDGEAVGRDGLVKVGAHAGAFEADRQRNTEVGQHARPIRAVRRRYVEPVSNEIDSLLHHCGIVYRYRLLQRRHSGVHPLVGLVSGRLCRSCSGHRSSGSRARCCAAKRVSRRVHVSTLADAVNRRPADAAA